MCMLLWYKFLITDILKVKDIVSDKLKLLMESEASNLFIPAAHIQTRAERFIW